MPAVTDEPSLGALQERSGNVDAPAEIQHHSAEQKMVVGAAVAGVALYIGYRLVQSFHEPLSQALWSLQEDEVPFSTRRQPPCIAVVNAAEEVRRCATEGLRGWLNLLGDVTLEFPSVMFVEEAEATCSAELPAETRRAALFAWAELQSRSTHLKGESSPQLCCVVYRSITEVGGQALDQWDVQSTAVHRWSGKPFLRRHCLGVSVDGRNVLLLTQDVEGVLDVCRYAEQAGAPVDCAALAQCFGVPSLTTFTQWRLAAETAGSSSPTSASSSAAARKLDCGRRANASFCPLWQSPYAIFAFLGVVLRYNRRDAAVYRGQLTLDNPSEHIVTDGSRSAWACSWKSMQRWISPQRRFAARQQRNECATWRAALSGSFVYMVELMALDGAAPEEDVLRVAEDHLTRWLRDGSSTLPISEAHPPTSRLCMADGPEQGTKQRSHKLRIDLSDIVCSVLSAEWLLLQLMNLLSACGLETIAAQLLVVPNALSHEERIRSGTEALFQRHAKETLQTVACGSIRRYGSGLPGSSSPPKELNGAECKGVSATGSQEVMGFVVAEHNVSHISQ